MENQPNVGKAVPFKTPDDVSAAFKWDSRQILEYLRLAVKRASKGSTRARKEQLQELLKSVKDIMSAEDRLAIKFEGRFIEPVIYDYVGPNKVVYRIQVAELCVAVGLIISETIEPIEVIAYETLQWPSVFCGQLLRIYAQWCQTLCGVLGVVPPKVVNIQYELNDGFIDRLMLGASWTSGDEAMKKKSKDFRKNVLTCIGLGPTISKTSPIRNEDKTGMNWGDCAETYPFILLASANDKSQVHGKAIYTVLPDGQWRYAKEKDGGRLNTIVACPNCQELVKALGGIEKNFQYVWGDNKRLIRDVKKMREEARLKEEKARLDRENARAEKMKKQETADEHEEEENLTELVREPSIARRRRQSIIAKESVEEEDAAKIAAAEARKAARAAKREALAARKVEKPQDEDTENLIPTSPVLPPQQSSLWKWCSCKCTLL
ncbi:hypothetical protein K432DRAFT_409370 [Lepidopterella palustris CBS 459.81]|uniref:Uncharacterized protein n=1 Tax=Lepidopterella palustris CBS 459.81 TaxID=1314670 RepID=A0A8E2JA76_9PEZI|nr:hypothetical protein K432DRAFT_409370 [Lepidopterella palustris CBS 459.81]